jgi:protein SCO1/2
VRLRRTLFFALAALALPAPAVAHDAAQDARLPMIGLAPDFVLTSQDGTRVALGDFRGKAVAVTFIFTSCADTCPLLTARMVEVQEDLGPAFGANVAFVSITVDPARDTPEVLKQYAESFGANTAGWAFLTGDPAEIREVERRYGIFAASAPDGNVDHTFLTSLVDPHGNLRVQYLGVRFDPEEFRRDLLSLLDEPD